MQIKNISEGPRGVWADGAVVMLMPGESRDLDVSAGDLAAARKTGWFNLDGVKADEPEEKKAETVDFSKRSDEELRAFLAEHDVKVDGRWSHERLISEAEKVKG